MDNQYDYTLYNRLNKVKRISINIVYISLALCVFHILLSIMGI